MQIRKKHGKAELVLLDHGLYKRITDDFRQAKPPISRAANAFCALTINNITFYWTQF